MDITLPSPHPCRICGSKNDRGVTLLIAPGRGRIQLSSSEIDAAIYSCPLCGAVRSEPLRQPETPPERLVAAA